MDSKGKFSVREAEPYGDEPELAPAEKRPEMHNIVEQAKGGMMRR